MHRVRTFSFPPAFVISPTQGEMLLMVQKHGSGIQPGQPTQIDQRDIPSHTALRSAIKNWGRQRRCLPSRLLLGDWLNTGLFMGSSWWFRLYCLFASTFLHLLHCLYLNPQVFLLLFFLLCSLSYCREVGEWAAARLTGCCLVLQRRPIRYVVKHIWLSGICCLLSKSCNAVEHTETSQRVMANKQCIRAGLHDLKDNSYKHLANSHLRKVVQTCFSGASLAFYITGECKEYFTFFEVTYWPFTKHLR